jgi:VanZ family protein
MMTSSGAVAGRAPAAHWARWLVPLSIAVGIFTITSWPTPPKMPGSSDKFVHFAAYAALGVGVAWAARTRTLVGVVPWLIAVSALGAIDEWHQQFIPGRRMDAQDWVADTAGAVSGLFLVTALNRRRELAA